MITEEIINRTCEYFGLTREELMSDTRKRDVALPRQIAMYACRKLTTLTCSGIGKVFHKNHSAVTYACDLIEALMDIDERVVMAVDVICEI